MKNLMMTASAALLAMSAAASAASLSLVGGSTDTIPVGSTGAESVGIINNAVLDALAIGTFNAADGFYSLDGYAGAQIELSSDAAVNVTIDVMGWEAGFTNTVTLAGTTLGKTAGSPTLSVASSIGSPLQTATVQVGAGTSLLDLAFESLGVGGVTNGDNDTVGRNFFASFGPGAEGDTSGEVLWVFYDDNGVAGDNHDDLVVRISVSAVPLPAGAVLLMTGLGAMALRRRRKSA